MSVFNRRNAAVGWLAVTVGKRVLKKKAKDAVPAIDSETRRPNRSALALLVAAVVGAATFAKKRGGGSSAADD